MFKKSKIKIVVSIMSILILLFIGMLCVIYVTSYADVYNQAQDRLKMYIKTYFEENNPNGISDRNINEILNDDKFFKDDQPPKQGDKVFLLSIFYSVVFSDNGEVINIDTNNSTIYSEEQLTELAFSIIEKDMEQGTIGKFIYRLQRGKGYTFVAFMDNTIVSESVTTLFRYTLVFGCVAIVIIFFLSLYLAKRIVQPLEESYQKQKQFISDAGHELKTPVSVVSTNAELLSREIGENQWLSNIQFENVRMSSLIKQLMELAKTENVKPQMGRIDFSRVVLGELLLFESIAYEKGIKLSYDSITENIFTYGNGEQLGQVVSILLDNAIEHSSNTGEITVTLSLKHGKAILTVTNEGKEIPKEQCDKLFERFYRTDFARSGEDNHYGLGLAITKSIVTAHNGDIHVSCGDGLVTFSVLIPIVRS